MTDARKSNRFSNTKAINGEASLWMEEFRGKGALDGDRFLYFYLKRV